MVLKLPPGTAITKLEAGQAVTCVMNDGTRRSGSYAGMGMPSHEHLLVMLTVLSR